VISTTENRSQRPPLVDFPHFCQASNRIMPAVEITYVLRIYAHQQPLPLKYSAYWYQLTWTDFSIEFSSTPSHS